MRVAILANVPVWTLPGLEHLHQAGHYATWLEPLIPAFENRKNLDIHWITMCKKVKAPVEHRALGQTFHILPRGRLSISMVSGYLAENRRIHSCLRELNPDLVHAWGSEEGYGIAGAMSGVENRLFTLQGCLSEYLRILGGGFLFRVQTLYERPTIKRYRVGTAESPAARELLLQLNPSMQVDLVDYGVNPEFFEANWNPAPTPELLFLGSVTKRKGIADLIKLARQPEFDHIKFKIAGEGGLREMLAAQASPNVEWLGKIDRPEVISNLVSAWALVMPTYSDTGPTVIKEARVVGLPVITTTGAGASCYVESEQSGYVTESGDLAALAKAITRVCSSRETCISMGKYDWEKQRMLLHPEATAQNFERIYLNLFDASRGRA